MAEKAPAAEQPYLAEDTAPTPWAEARERLAEADTYWLATVRPDGLTLAPRELQPLGAILGLQRAEPWPRMCVVSKR